jgi:phage shock protein C
MVQMKQLRRPQDRKRIAGVCAGVADHFGWSVSKVRAVFLFGALFGAGEIAYAILWIVVPKDEAPADPAPG